MILRRLTENLRAQNWTAITIEFLIVVIGVFLGIQVANWNQARVDQRETDHLLANLRPELESQLKFFGDIRAYYGVTRNYAEQALAGWNGSSEISNEQFVIAAYQATQIAGIGTNAENWSLTFGGEQLRNIEDLEVRRNLLVVLTSDYDPVAYDTVASPYREQVRRIIPIGIQDAIRRECGDRVSMEELGIVRVSLPDTCSLEIPQADAARVAGSLRAKPEIAQELTWHLATIATVLDDVNILEEPIRELHRDLTETS